MNKERNVNVKIVDAVMGSGKTSWAIQYMNEHPEKSFIYITPFLSEIRRIKKATSGRFCEPVNRGEGKLESLKDLLAAGKDIVTTHQLFLHLDEEAREAIANHSYICILDEELDMIKSYGDALPPDEKSDFALKPDDVRYLVGEGQITIEPFGENPKTGYAVWSGTQGYSDYKYSRVREFCQRRTLICVDGIALFWTYPPDVFSLFEDTYALTYQVEGSNMYCYLMSHGISIQKFGVVGNREFGYNLCKYSSDLDAAARLRFKELLNILDIPQNNISADGLMDKRGVLSKTWFDNSKRKDRDALRRALGTVRKLYLGAKSHELMWTCLQDYEDSITAKGCRWTVSNEYEAKSLAIEELERAKAEAKAQGYTLHRDLESVMKTYKCFVSLNARASNDYANRTKLAYLANIFMNPEVKKIFTQQGVEVNEDLFALNMMIQWIWRSAIRNGEEVWAWIPAWRMRGLLEKWLSPSA